MVRSCLHGAVYVALTTRQRSPLSGAPLIAVTHVLCSDPLLLWGGCLGRLRWRSRRRAILALKEALHSVHGCHAVFLWVLQHSSLRMPHSVTLDVLETLPLGLSVFLRVAKQSCLCMAKVVIAETMKKYRLHLVHGITCHSWDYVERHQGASRQQHSW